MSNVTNAPIDPSRSSAELPKIIEENVPQQGLFSSKVITVYTVTFKDKDNKVVNIQVNTGDPRAKHTALLIQQFVIKEQAAGRAYKDFSKASFNDVIQFTKIIRKEPMDLEKAKRDPQYATLASEINHHVKQAGKFAFQEPNMENEPVASPRGSQTQEKSTFMEADRQALQKMKPTFAVTTHQKDVKEGISLLQNTIVQLGHFQEAITQGHRPSEDTMTLLKANFDKIKGYEEKDRKYSEMLTNPEVTAHYRTALQLYEELTEKSKSLPPALSTPPSSKAQPAPALQFKLALIEKKLDTVDLNLDAASDNSTLLKAEKELNEATRELRTLSEQINQFDGLHQSDSAQFSNEATSAHNAAAKSYNRLHVQLLRIQEKFGEKSKDLPPARFSSSSAAERKKGGFNPADFDKFESMNTKANSQKTQKIVAGIQNKVEGFKDAFNIVETSFVDRNLQISYHVKFTDPLTREEVNIKIDGKDEPLARKITNIIILSRLNTEGEFKYSKKITPEDVKNYSAAITHPREEEVSYSDETLARQINSYMERAEVKMGESTSPLVHVSSPLYSGALKVLDTITRSENNYKSIDVLKKTIESADKLAFLQSCKPGELTHENLDPIKNYLDEISKNLQMINGTDPALKPTYDFAVRSHVDLYKKYQELRNSAPARLPSPPAAKKPPPLLPSSTRPGAGQSQAAPFTPKPPPPRTLPSRQPISAIPQASSSEAHAPIPSVHEALRTVEALRSSSKHSNNKDLTNLNTHLSKLNEAENLLANTTPPEGQNFERLKNILQELHAYNIELTKKLNTLDPAEKNHFWTFSKQDQDYEAVMSARSAALKSYKNINTVIDNQQRSSINASSSSTSPQIKSPSPPASQHTAAQPAPAPRPTKPVPVTSSLPKPPLPAKLNTADTSKKPTMKEKLEFFERNLDVKKPPLKNPPSA